MTVCIAAIAEKDTPYPKIIFCADRLQSTFMTFEHNPKIFAFDNIILMFSGFTEDCSEVIENVAQEVNKQEIKNVRLVTELCCIFAKKHFQKLAEEKFLNSRGVSFDIFYSQQNPLPLHLFNIIDDKIKLFETGFSEVLSFIVAGIDETGAQIYEVLGNGEKNNKNYIGFSIIGEGFNLSLPEMTKNKYTSTASLGEVLFRVFNAKKISERISSVGKETDLGFISLTGDGNKESDKIKVQIMPNEFKKFLEDNILSLRESESEFATQVSHSLNESIYKPRQVEQPTGKLTDSEK